MSTSSHILRIASLVLIALLGTHSACSAQTTSDMDATPDEDRWQDWQLNLTAKTFEHYLDYPTSSIRTLVRVAAEYAQPIAKAPKLYEYLYYTTSQVIGCKRNRPLGITPGTAGIIKIVSTNQEEFYALGNAVLHVYLDIGLRKCMTKCVLVPTESFQGIIGALCQQGFHRGSQGSRPGVISIRIVAADDSTEILRMQPGN